MVSRTINTKERKKQRHKAKQSEAKRSEDRRCASSSSSFLLFFPCSVYIPGLWGVPCRRRRRWCSRSSAWSAGRRCARRGGWRDSRPWTSSPSERGRASCLSSTASCPVHNHKHVSVDACTRVSAMRIRKPSWSPSWVYDTRNVFFFTSLISIQ